MIHQLKTDNPRISWIDIKLNVRMLLELERANKRLVEASCIGHSSDMRMSIAAHIWKSTDVKTP